MSHASSNPRFQIGLRRFLGFFDLVGLMGANLAVFGFAFGFAAGFSTAGALSHFILCNGAPHDPQANSCPARALGFRIERLAQ